MPKETRTRRSQETRQKPFTILSRKVLQRFFPALRSHAYHYDPDTTVKNFTVPEGVKEIKQETFKHCASLESVQLPTSLLKLGSESFSHCDALTSIVIPNGVREIPLLCFADSSLEKITLPESLVHIHQRTFDSCKLLTSITIPKNVKQIDSQAFIRCYNLKKVILPANCIVAPNAFCHCFLLETILVQSKEDIDASRFMHFFYSEEEFQEEQQRRQRLGRKLLSGFSLKQEVIIDNEN